MTLQGFGPSGDSTTDQRSVVVAEELVRDEVVPDRRQEILRYLCIFGYDSETTALRVYHAPPIKGGSRGRFRLLFNKAESRRVVIVGKTRDPVLGFELVRADGTGEGSEPELLGFLIKALDPEARPPHEVLPLDFTPTPIDYPTGWSDLYPNDELWIGIEVATKHVALARTVQRYLRVSWRLSDARGRWGFLPALEKLGSL